MSERAEGARPQWHVYYQLRFSLKSAMLIGSGESVYTDRDLLRNGLGKPFVPGTAVAGMLRAMLADPNDQKALFGVIENGVAAQSALSVYDAALLDETATVSKRDSVALDAYKTALDKKKFDYQALEPPAEFVGLIEIRKDAPDAVREKAEALMARLASQGCAFGSKKARGMGRMLVSVRKMAFDLSNAQQKAAWLAFDPFLPNAFDHAAQVAPVCGGADGETRVALKLKLAGGLSIREYTTDVKGADYRTLAYAGGGALVPGASWAGAFRARVREFAGEQASQLLFGYVLEPAQATEAQAAAADGVQAKPGKEKTKARKSLISFSETQITGGAPKLITRNAIDRFSGKTKDGALYTEQTYYGGGGELIVTLRPMSPDGMDASQEALGLSWQEAERLLKQARAAVGAAIADLHHGFLAVGGLTAVGRGLFEISSIDINGQPFPMDGRRENALIGRLAENEKGGGEA